ncbi:MAG TPA: flagellar export chaperone FliS [Candidatus Latescibacteria bacterium]|nr:flagellar export chaperone FliS [Candidatus Latescibacterota bacterium]
MALNNPTPQYQEAMTEGLSQGDLILMTYDGAIRFSRKARARLESGDLERKGTYLNKARDTISALERSLNLEAGQEIASSLQKLYSFMIEQLDQANLANDPRPIDLVITLLTQLRDAWNQIINGPMDVSY